jgi:hypothetical protein
MPVSSRSLIVEGRAWNGLLKTDRLKAVRLNPGGRSFHGKNTSLGFAVTAEVVACAANRRSTGIYPELATIFF